MNLKDNRKGHFRVVAGSGSSDLLPPLKSQLYRDGDPFKQRWIVTPSQAIRSWIEESLMEDPEVGVSMGLHYGSLKEAIFYLLSQNEIKLSKSHYPSPLEMTLALDQALVPFMDELDLTPRKREQLARSLTPLYQELCLYGQEVIEEMKLRRERRFEETLFLRLFEEHPSWAPLYQLLNEASRSYSTSLSMELHLFGLHFISEKELALLKTFSQSVEITLYLLRPTPHFMGDLLTEKQLRRVRGEWKSVSEAEKIQLEESYYSQHSLLANCARLSKKMDRLLEEEEIEFIEREWGGDLLLHRLQEDLYENQPPEETLLADDSIEIWVAPSKRREVEIVHDRVIELINGGMEPHEITLVAPDIHPYSSLLKTVFGNAIPLEILDRKERQEEMSERGLVDLLSLAESRFRKEEWVPLLSNSALLKKHEISEEEAEWMRAQLKKMDVTWGLSGEHRSQRMEDDLGAGEAVDEKGTWAREWRRLFQSFVVGEKRLSLTEAPLLGKLRDLFETLVEELQPFQAEAVAPFSTWLERVHTLFETHFAHEEEFVVSRTLLLFGRIDPDLKERPLSWRLFKALFLKAVADARSDHAQRGWKPLRAFSLRGGRLPPAKALFILGMNDENFLSKRRKSAHDLLVEPTIGDLRPTPLDEERELFLQALLTAEEKLYFTLPSTGESPEMSLSPLLLDLQRSLNQNLIQLAPSLVLDAADFEEETKAVTAPAPPEESEVEVKVYQLAQLFKNPLRLYLEERLKLSFEEEEHRDDFTFTALDRYLLKKEHFEKVSPDEERLPAGIFREVATKQREKDRKQLKEVEKFYTIELKEGVKESWLAGERLIEHPPLHFEVEGRNIQVTGRLEYLTEEGLCLFSKSSPEKRLEAWPKALLASHLTLPKELPVALRTVTFADGGESFSLPEGDLEEVLRLYLQAVEKPLPFSSKHLIEWKKKRLHPAKAWMKARVSDPWSHWFFTRCEVSEEELHHWAAVLETVFNWDEALIARCT